MGRVLSGLALLIFMIACGDELPEGVAPARVMPSLLFDMHLLDSRMTNAPIDSSRMLWEQAYGAVFEKYGLDSTEFRLTMDYYMTRPGELLGFYEIVQKRLQKHIDEEQQRIEEESRVRRISDSLHRVRMRDSLFWVARQQEKWDQIRHLLFRHEADSTVDEPVPFTWEEYSARIYQELGAWKLNFIEDFNVDSVRATTGRDQTDADTVRIMEDEEDVDE